MTCCGNLIARAMAMVAIATMAAFVNWGFQPIMGLTSPKGLPDPQKSPENPGATPAPSGDPAAGTDPAGATDAGQAAKGAFDPTQLETEIHTPDTFQLWQLGTVVFIDARPAHEYEAGHIPFAYLIPAESIDAGRLGDMMEQGGVGADQRVVVYCEGGLCTASELVAFRLQDMGFTKIHIDVDGFPGWQEAGHEIETGPDAVLGEVP